MRQHPIPQIAREKRLRTVFGYRKHVAMVVCSAMVLIYAGAIGVPPPMSSTRYWRAHAPVIFPWISNRILVGGQSRYGQTSWHAASCNPTDPRRWGNRV